MHRYLFSQCLYPGVTSRLSPPRSQQSTSVPSSHCLSFFSLELRSVCQLLCRFPVFSNGIYFSLGPGGLLSSNSFGDYDLSVSGWGNNSTVRLIGMEDLTVTGNWEALPEPSTLGLIGLGLLGLGAMRRRRRYKLTTYAYPL